MAKGTAIIIDCPMPNTSPYVRNRNEIGALNVKQIAEPIKPIAPTRPPAKPIFTQPKKSTRKLDKKLVKNAIPKENEPIAN